MIFTAIITPDPDGGFVALNPETGSTSQGESAVEALTNLKEATELYLEEFPMNAVAQSWMTTFEVACA